MSRRRDPRTPARDVEVGRCVEIEANGETHQLYIVDIQDGRVTLARSPRPAKNAGKWWLPVAYVREHARLIK